MSDFIEKNFIAARFHAKHQSDALPRFGVEVTPTALIADANGNERYRVEGFHEADEFLGELEKGLRSTR